MYVLLIVIVMHTCMQGCMEQLELEKNAISEELQSSQQRAAELQALHTRVADQLSNEKAARQDAEQALHTCTKERDALEAACDVAAGQISQLQVEVAAVRKRLEEQQQDTDTVLLHVCHPRPSEHSFLEATVEAIQCLQHL
jgi:predicted  nucleic acid-binding Zn-ribbon protein